MPLGSTHLLAFAGAATVLLSWCTASAETTAVYDSPQGLRLTVECAANGDVRQSISSASDRGYWLIKDNVGYLVRSTPNGLVADSATDLAEATVEIAAMRNPGR